MTVKWWRVQHRIGMARVGVDMRIAGTPKPTGPRRPDGYGLDPDRKNAREAARYRATRGNRRNYQCSECDSYDHTAPRCPLLRSST